MSWLAKSSAIYETCPVGPTTQDFLNAAIELRTAADPVELLDALLELEHEHGRVRVGPGAIADRTLDLDLLMYLSPTDRGFESVTLATSRLRLPHPRMLERDFVLAPLVDVLGDEPVLAGKTAQAHLDVLRRNRRSLIARRDEPLVPPLVAEPFDGDWD